MLGTLEDGGPGIAADRRVTLSGTLAEKRKREKHKKS